MKTAHSHITRGKGTEKKYIVKNNTSIKLNCARKEIFL